MNVFTVILLVGTFTGIANVKGCPGDRKIEELSISSESSDVEKALLEDLTTLENNLFQKNPVINLVRSEPKEALVLNDAKNIVQDKKNDGDKDHSGKIRIFKLKEITAELKSELIAELEVAAEEGLKEVQKLATTVTSDTWIIASNMSEIHAMSSLFYRESIKIENDCSKKLVTFYHKIIDNKDDPYGITLHNVYRIIDGVDKIANGQDADNLIRNTFIKVTELWQKILITRMLTPRKLRRLFDMREKGVAREEINHVIREEVASIIKIKEINHAMREQVASILKITLSDYLDLGDQYYVPSAHTISP